MSVNILNKTTRELEPIAGNSGGSSNASPDFVGTASEWNNLSATQKAQYDKSKGVTVNFTDDDLPDDIIGDTDISDIGDGTLTGGLADHEERIGDSETDITNLSSALATKMDSSVMTFTNMNQINFSRGGDVVYIEWVNLNIRYNVAFHPNEGIKFNRYDGSTWTNVWTIPKP